MDSEQNDRTWCPSVDVGDRCRVVGEELNITVTDEWQECMAGQVHRPQLQDVYEHAGLGLCPNPLGDALVQMNAPTREGGACRQNGSRNRGWRRGCQ